MLRLEVDPSVSRAAAALGVSRKFVTRWRNRYLRLGRLVSALCDAPRSGRPAEIDSITRHEVIAMACGKPADFGVRERQLWSLDALHEVFVAKHPRVAISRTSVFRILHDAEIRPHRIRLWLHSPDPKFREKVAAICALYLNPPKDAVVLCVDEKTGMQALGRKHPLRLPGPGRDGRWEFEYVRNGTRTMFAAFDPHSGRVYAQVRRHRKAPDLLEFMREVARRHQRKQVHIVWDNLNIHSDGRERRWKKFNARHGGRFHFHFTPIHASWVNQVEIFFSIVQRRVLRYHAFDSARELERSLLAFVETWNAEECHPFRWTFKGYPLQRIAKQRPEDRRLRRLAA